MSDYFAIVDAGNGRTNAIIKKASGKRYKTVDFASVRARVTGQSLGLGDMELSIDYADWLGNRFAVGDNVTLATRKQIETHRGQDRYGNEFHQFLTAYAIAQGDVKSGNVNLTLFAPPKYYKIAKENILNGFNEQGGHPTIKLKNDKKPREWQYDSIAVYPEGLGAIACFTLNDKGQMVDSDALNNTVALLDIGMWSLDVIITENGVFNPEHLDNATYDRGIHDNVLAPILRALHGYDDDFTVLTVFDVDNALRKGIASGDFSIVVAGKEIDIQELFHDTCNRYADYVFNTVVDSDYNGFRGMRVLAVGGGSILLAPAIKEWLGDRLIDASSYKHTKGLHPTYYNAAGGYRLAMAKQNS